MLKSKTFSVASQPYEVTFFFPEMKNVSQLKWTRRSEPLFPPFIVSSLCQHIIMILKTVMWSFYTRVSFFVSSTVREWCHPKVGEKLPAKLLQHEKLEWKQNLIKVPNFWSPTALPPVRTWKIFNNSNYQARHHSHWPPDDKNLPPIRARERDWEIGSI